MGIFTSIRAFLTQEKKGRGIKLPERFRKISYLQHILENMSQAMVILDKYGFVQFVNNSFCQSWDYLPDDVVGQHFTMLVSPAVHEEEFRVFQELLNGNVVKDHQTMLRRKDGRASNALLSASFESIGTNKYIVAMVTDVDELITTRDRLSRSEKELKEIYNTSNAMQWEASASTRTFRKISGRVAHFFGFTTDEWLTPGFIDGITLSVNGDTTNDLFSALKSTQMPATFELQINTRLYGPKWLRLDANENKNGPAYIYSGFIFDITKTKEAELENERLLLKMRETNAIKDDFLAQVSHELRTPISIILGWVELLIKGRIESEKVVDAYQYIEKNARMQINLIDDLLDLARIEKGTLHSRIEIVNITECLKNAIDSFQVALQSKKIKLSSRIPDRIIDVIGDHDRLTQIFWNILSNAIKFTPNGGAILVDIEVFLDKVEIRIEDTGKGIEQSFLPHIFEKFTRESDLVKRQSGGLGLGLSIVKTLTETHGGTITIDSEGVNKGSCVTLRFPYISRQDTEIASIPVTGTDEVSQSLEFLKNLRILIVDDVRDVTDILKEMLISKGADVLTCANVSDAYQAVLDFKPQILISDIAMPGQSGVDLIQKIRSLSGEDGGKLPAAALTAFVRSTSEKHLLDAGFNKVLSKPVRSADLYSSIRELQSIGQTAIQ